MGTNRGRPAASWSVAAIFMTIAAVSSACSYPEGGPRSKPSVSAPAPSIGGPDGQSQAFATKPARPAGSATVGCENARATSTGFTPSPEDLLLGPLTYPSISAMAGENPTMVGGLRFFKEGAQLPRGAAATVTIDAPASEYVGILTEEGPRQGYTSVQYVACTDGPAGWLFWVGGFVTSKPENSCVPITVQIDGELTARHAFIPMGADVCPAAR